MMELVSTINSYVHENIVIPTRFIYDKQTYTIIKIIPYKTGYDEKVFEKIINTISKYNSTFFERLNIDINKKAIVYRPVQPICFEVMYTKNKISYYFAIPSCYGNIFVSKLKFLMNKSDVMIVQDYLSDFNDCLKQRFTYKKGWIFSLNSDDKININDNMLSIHKDLQDGGDKVLLQYALKPLFDYEWKNEWQNRYNKFLNTGSVQGGYGFLEILLNITDFILDQLDMIINSIMLAIAGEEPLDMSKQKEEYAKLVNTDTTHKSVYDGFKVNANLYVKAANNLVAQNICRSVQTIYQDLNGDNSIRNASLKVVKEASRECGGFIANTKECKQLIKTPSEEMMKKYEDLIDKVNISEVDMDKDLFSKGIQLGEMKRDGIYKPIYFGDDLDSISKPLIFISPMGGGKSTFSRMYSVGYAEQGDSVVLFETIDGRSKDIVRDYLNKGYPENKIIVLDYANDDYVLPLLWNEITDVYLNKLRNANMDVDKYRILEELSGIISTQLKGFIDTIQVENREQMLTPTMSKILNNITQLVFMNDGTFAMVKDCLFDVELRHNLLNNLSLPPDLPFCKEIRKIDNEPPNSTTLKGIESRLNILMDNMTMKKIFSVNPPNKINFSKWIDNGCVVIINVPENKFGDNINPIITFLMAKLWMSLLATRVNIPENQRKLCHIVLDEIHRFPFCLFLLQNKILECRKWRIKPLFFIHNMDVFSRMYENLKAAGATFIMMPTSEYNFSRVKEFFEPYGYSELKEVEKLNAKYPKSRFALTSIHYKNVNYPCVIRLLPPIENHYTKVDRSYLDKKYAAYYGVKQDDYYLKLFKGEENNQVTNIDNDVEDNLFYKEVDNDKGED